MFNLFKKKIEGKTIKFKVNGMHCTSCSTNIDLALEDVKGVKNSNTSYASAFTSVTYDENETDFETIKNAVEELGYQVVLVTSLSS